MIAPLHIRFPASEIDDLRARIAATRWPDDAGDDWERGTRPSTLRRLLEAWSAFDVAGFERQLRAEEHLRVTLEHDDVVHVWRLGDPTHPPLVLMHGWPDSFVRFRLLAPLLADAFHVTVPSVPGYGFSTPPPPEAGASRWVAGRLLAALDQLGVGRFGVYGGDIGTGIAEQLALAAPARVAALNLSDVPRWRAQDDPDLTPDEQQWIAGMADWAEREGAYAHLQRTKPQTLAAGLTDSPAALASWMLEKFQGWGEGDAFARIPVELMLQNLTVYWFTRTPGSAARYYFDSRRTPPAGARVEVPTGFGLFPHDIDHGPESFARRWYPVERFTRFERGGHFGAMEEPDALAADLRAFFGPRVPAPRTPPVE